MIPKDWTLLVIAASPEKPLQPVHLQKALFLLDRNLSRAQLQVNAFYEFEPYDYGPFCSDIYSDAEELCHEGLVHIDQHLWLSYRQYLVTKPGQAKAEELREMLTRDVTAYLDDVVRWVTSLSFRQLIAAIYKAYPAMKVNSVFKD
jgi:uncharacterized protein